MTQTLTACLALLCQDIRIYQMMMSYFKGTADAVAEYCTAVSCPNAPNTFKSPVAFSGALRTLLHETRGRKAPEGKCSKRNTPLKACSNYYVLYFRLVLYIAT